LIANMVPTGRSPELSAAQLQAIGFSLAIWPAALMSVACGAMAQALQHLQAHGTTAGTPAPTFNMNQLHELMGFPEVWAFEKRWAQPE
jgi:2-methylisocitrate lyase-like PEP mutase family enzyme